MFIPISKGLQLEWFVIEHPVELGNLHHPGYLGRHHRVIHFIWKCIEQKHAGWIANGCKQCKGCVENDAVWTWIWMGFIFKNTFTFPAVGEFLHAKSLFELILISEYIKTEQQISRGGKQQSEACRWQSTWLTEGWSSDLSLLPWCLNHSSHSEQLSNLQSAAALLCLSQLLQLSKWVESYDSCFTAPFPCYQGNLLFVR